MVLQCFLYLLVPLNRAELTRANYYKFLERSTSPARIYPPPPGKGLRLSLKNSSINLPVARKCRVTASPFSRCYYLSHDITNGATIYSKFLNVDSDISWMYPAAEVNATAGNMHLVPAYSRSILLTK